MTFQQRKEAAPRLRALPLEQVLLWCGARRDEIDRRKWHTPRGVLSLSGAKFMNWSLGVGGGGALDLVMQLKGLNFKAAVDWLAQHTGQSSSESVATTVTLPPLSLPAPDPRRLNQVRHYLTIERGIPVTLLEPLIQAGTLYADSRANAVFLLREADGHPVGAELRGTSGPCWRGLAPGSRRDLGYFSVPAQARPELILCESAIDALSCLALHPKHGCISTAGARPHPRWLGLLLEEGRQIACGFDRDPAGENMAQVMLASYPAIRRLRPEAHDWNDQLKARAYATAKRGQQILTTWKEESSAASPRGQALNSCTNMKK